MALGRNIAKNALFLMVATTGQKLVAFIAFTLVARFVGPQTTGAYFYGVSVTSVFVILSDLGMTPVIIRAVAGDAKNAARLFGAAARAKLVLVPIAVLASLGYGVARGESSVIMATIAVACIAMAADACHLVLYGALRGRQDLRPESYGMFIGQTASGVAAVIAAYMGYGSVGLAGALAIGSLWNVGWALWNVRRFGVKFDVPLISDFRALVHQALPFAVAGMAVKVYSYADSLLLQAFKGETSVGYYAVAYKLTYAMQFLPLTFSAALYPALAAAHARGEHEELRRVFLGCVRLMAACAFPITAGLSALAPRLIPLLYGAKFAGSIAAMSVLPWVLLPIFMDFPVGALLNATHRAHLKTTAMVATMVVNVILNVLLVPAYGPMGAAWAGVFSFWFMLFVGFFFTWRDAGGLKPLVSILARALVAAAISWIAWRELGVYMPLIMSAIFGGCVAVLAAFGVGLVTIEDLLPVWTHLRKKFSGGDVMHED